MVILDSESLDLVKKRIGNREKNRDIAHQSIP